MGRLLRGVFGGERFVSLAPALRGGRVITWFAGHDVDLRGATLDPSGVTLDLRTMYGGTQIAVPEGWRVGSHVISIFGGARVTTSPDASWSGADRLPTEALPPVVDEPPLAVDEPLVG